jgi:hypothetical protein
VTDAGGRRTSGSAPARRIRDHRSRSPDPASANQDRKPLGGEQGRLRPPLLFLSQPILEPGATVSSAVEAIFAWSKVLAG